MLNSELSDASRCYFHMNAFCDPDTGICTPSSLQELEDIGKEKGTDKTEIIYVGDPMCSWCWGISPQLMKLRDHYRGEGLSYRIVLGGLRPGGGDPWNDQMKNFLKEHWEHVNHLSGQAFGYKLMELDEFNYDTEPSCRAVVAARPLVKEREMEFFEEVQANFYLHSEDPTKPIFYAGICEKLGVDYNDFLVRFGSDQVRKETLREFNLNRKWGVRGYPTTMLLHMDNLHLIANGYATFEQMKSKIEFVLMSVKAVT